MVGQYRILALLGEGGMGAVYEAEDTLLDIKVALKSLKSELTKQPELVERFREEAKIQVKLNNPHIVKLYTFMRDGQDYYMVMEYVEGRTLDSFVERVGRLNYGDAIQIIVQALDGLEHAHHLGVIHRDIKLANIMITPEGIVKVMDFGIARVLGSRRLTRAGNIVGTLNYISPEALNGHEITPAADIYSCGIMLYKMVTGSLPFISENDFLLARMHVEMPPPPLTTHVPDFPRELEELILRALAKNPAERFQSAGQMAQALEQFLESDQAANQGDQTEGSASFWRRFAPGKPNLGKGDSGAQAARPRSGGVAAAAATANRRIEELMTQNRMREALDLVQRSLREYPDDTTLRDLRSRIEREQRHYEEDLRRSAQEIRGYLGRGLSEMALSAAETSLNRYSGEVSLLELLDEAKRQVQEKKKNAHIATHVEEEIRPLVQEGRFSEAVAIVMEALGLNPEQPELSSLLGRTIKAQRDQEKRKLILECRAEAEQLANDGLYDQAVSRIERTRLTQPDDPSLLTLLRHLLEARDEAKKRADLDRVSRKIDELEAADRLEDADSALQVALRRFPRDQKLLAKRQQIQDQIAARKRLAGIQSVRASTAAFRESNEWTRALNEIEIAIDRIGADAELSALRIELESGHHAYQQQVLTAADDARTELAAGKFEAGIESLVALCQKFPREDVFVQLLGETRQALANQQRHARIQDLAENVDRLIAAGSANKAADLLSEAPPELSGEPEIVEALHRVRQAQQVELQHAAVKEALRKSQSFEKKEDWERGVAALREALALYPGIADLEIQLQKFENKLEARRRAEALKQAEDSCRQDVARLIEVSEWKDALSAIDKVLLKFPGEASLVRFRREIEERQSAWLRLKDLNQAVNGVENLLQSAQLDEAANAIEREWERFPDAEIFLTLSVRLEQLREEAQAARARLAAVNRASGLILNHRWDEAECALAEAEGRVGTDARVAEVRRNLEAARREHEARVATCKVEADRFVQAEKWPEAIAVSEQFLREYPETPEISELLDRTSQAFKAWRKSKELDRALQAIRGLLNNRRWDEAATAAESGRLRFPDSENLFAPLAKQAENERLAEAQKQTLDAAVDRANRLAAQLRWDDAVGELAEAEATLGTCDSLTSARLSIDAERKKHHDRVDASGSRAGKWIASADWDKALKELSNPAFDGEAEIEQLRAVAKEGRVNAEIEQRINRAVSEIEQAIQRQDWALSAAGLKAAQSAFPGEKRIEALRVSASEAKESHQRETRMQETLADAERQTDPSHAIKIIDKAIHEFGEHRLLRSAIERFQSIQADRSKALARMESEARAFLEKKDAQGALQYLQGLSADSRQSPALIAIEQQASEEAKVAAHKRREAGAAAAARNVEKLLKEVSSVAAKEALLKFLKEFGDLKILQDAGKQVEAALEFESQIQNSLDAGRFEEAEIAWIEGAGSASVAALGSEIERRRAEHEKLVSEFALRVRLLIRETRFDQAARAIHEGSALGPTDLLRAELAEAQTKHASEQRIGEYRKKLERAWASGDFVSANAVVQNAMRTDSDSALVQGWTPENERLQEAWNWRRKLDEASKEFQRRLEANDLTSCRDIVERFTRDQHPGAPLEEWGRLIQQKQAFINQLEQALRLAEELRSQGQWDAALASLNNDSLVARSGEVARLSAMIRKDKQAAERIRTPSPSPSFDRTIVAGLPLELRPEITGVAAVPEHQRNRKPLFAALAAAAVAAVVGGVWMTTTNKTVEGELTVSPVKLAFAGAGTGTVQVTSPVPVSYKASGSEAWLTIRGKDGTTPGTLTVETNPDRVAPGQHRAMIVVQTGEKKAKEIEVVMTIDQKKVPLLTVAPRSLSISYQVSQPLPSARRLEISGVPPDQCKVRVTRGAEWLSASIGPGAAIIVSFRLPGKSAGAYVGELEISVVGGAPVKIPVNLNIQAFKL